MGQTEEFLKTNGDVKQALDRALNTATNEADTPAEMHIVAQAYSDLGLGGSGAMGLRMKIGAAIKSLEGGAGSTGNIEPISHLSAALGLID